MCLHEAHFHELAHTPIESSAQSRGERRICAAFLTYGDAYKSVHERRDPFQFADREHRTRHDCVKLASVLVSAAEVASDAQPIVVTQGMGQHPFRASFRRNFNSCNETSDDPRECVVHEAEERQEILPSGSAIGEIFLQV